MAFRVSAQRAQEVRELSQAGHSNRAVAAQTGISRDTVNLIVKEEWRPTAVIDEIHEEEPGNERRRHVDRRRCSGCGGMLNSVPCVFCEVQRFDREEGDGTDLDASRMRHARRQVERGEGAA